MSDISLIQALEMSGAMSFCPKGCSMRPFIKEGDTVVVEKLLAKAKKYDVILYKYNNALVLHRVKRVVSDGYLVMGDNQLYKEKVLFNDTVAKMVGFYKNEKYIACSNLSYRIKVFFWSIIPIRWTLKKLRSLFKK